VKGRAWDFAAAVDIEVNPQRCCGFDCSESDFTPDSRNQRDISPLHSDLELSRESTPKTYTRRCFKTPPPETRKSPTSHQ